MAELSLSILSLVALFTEAVDCFEYIQLGRNCSRDVHTSLLQLNCISLRLSRWGESVGLSGDVHGADELRSGLQTIDLGSDREIKLAQEILEDIISRFKEAESHAVKWDKAPVQDSIFSSQPPSRSSTSDSRRVSASPGKDFNQQGSLELAEREGSTAALMLSKRISVILRRRTTSNSNNVAQDMIRVPQQKLHHRVRWALNEQRRFTYLIEQIKTLVDELIALFPKAHERQQHLALEEVAELGQNGQLSQLQSVAAEMDLELSNALKQASSDCNFSWSSANVTAEQNESRFCMHVGSMNGGQVIGQNFGTITSVWNMGRA